MQSETLVEEFSRLVREYKQDDGPGGIEAWNLIADFAVDNADAIEAALSAAEPQPAPSVAVKALEWSDEDNGDFIAQSIVGWHHIGLPHLTWNLMTPNGDVPSFNTLKEAKAAAQADYEARVSSALSAQVQDVAGWRPIETAPKDGTIILLFGGAYHPFPGYWELRRFNPTRPWVSVVNESRLDEHVPTHWMPLPPVPAAPAKQEGGTNE